MSNTKTFDTFSDMLDECIPLAAQDLPVFNAELMAACKAKQEFLCDQSTVGGEFADLKKLDQLNNNINIEACIQYDREMKK